MKTDVSRFDKGNVRSELFITAAILTNVIIAYVANRLGMPVYLDTIGTIFISYLGGLFPGIVTAVATNLLCAGFNPEAIYFSFVNVMIAGLTVWFTGRYSFKRRINMIWYVLMAGIISGGFGGLVQWDILGHAQNQAVVDVIDTIHFLPKVATFYVLNIILNIFDKGLSLAVALLIIRFIPPATQVKLKNFGWKQRPLSEDELKVIKKRGGESETSIRTRMSLTLVGVSFALVLIMGFICVQLYFNSVKEERKEVAINAAKFAADVVDGDKLDLYIRNGSNVPGYLETEHTLSHIRDNALGVKYLYVLKVENDGCYFVFDLETEDTPAYEPGAKVEFEEAFKEYIPLLLAGKEIEPVESDDLSGWVLTAYEPIRDNSGETVGYAGADVSLEYTAMYMKDFVIKVILIMAGFFILVIAYGLWSTSVNTVYPIGSITSCLDKFAKSGDEQSEFDDHVKKIRALDIRTGDEVERLYQAICKMTLEQAEQMREIRHYADSTAKMQDGLIITMADMVESRDSDTGAHVQKTAAYVKIIAEGLRKKGYYAEKITDKYIADLVRSAPLHDVGKINIPDNVLNKPGKLTDEEFAIMKTHATAGRKIMERAINTVHGENYLKEARNMAGYHHERWDGKGYPDGLHGEVIPLAARIMSVADVFDALTSPRVYKPAFPLEKALSILEEGAGTQFDPKVVEVFMENLTEVKVVLKKYNNQDT